MSVEAPPIARIQLGGGAVFQIWVRHLTSLLLPVSALAFLFTGPHVWYVSPLFMLPVVWAFVLDNGPQVEQRQPIDELPAWPFDALVYLLGALLFEIVTGEVTLAFGDVQSIDLGRGEPDVVLVLGAGERAADIQKMLQIVVPLVAQFGGMKSEQAKHQGVDMQVLSKVGKKLQATLHEGVQQPL